MHSATIGRLRGESDGVGRSLGASARSAQEGSLLLELKCANEGRAEPLA
jgi:hypothetical protein